MLINIYVLNLRLDSRGYLENMTCFMRPATDSRTALAFWPDFPLVRGIRRYLHQRLHFANPHGPGFIRTIETFHPLEGSLRDWPFLPRNDSLVDEFEEEDDDDNREEEILEPRSKSRRTLESDGESLEDEDEGDDQEMDQDGKDDELINLAFEVDAEDQEDQQDDLHGEREQAQGQQAEMLFVVQNAEINFVKN